jgi:hypothetical protein
MPILQGQDLADLRFLRDQLLRKTDHWCLTDANPTEEMLAYRQALRDITETADTLEGDVFPPLPSEGRLANG